MADLRPRVLIVDDRLEMAEMLADGLAEHGYDPVATASSRAFIEATSRSPASLSPIISETCRIAAKMSKSVRGSTVTTGTPDLRRA